MQSALREIQGLESKLRDLKFSERKALSSVSNLRQSS